MKVAVIIISIVLLIIIAFFAFLLATGNPKKVINHDWLYEKPIAHRGYHKKESGIVENTPSSFQRAIDHGFNIEMDIGLTKDEEIIVFHDDDFNRVCGVDAKVADLTFEEVENLTILGTTDKIMKFEDFLKLINGQAGLVIEYKTQGKRNNILCEKSMELLKNYKGKYVVQSFDPFIVKWFKKNYPIIPRGQLCMRFNMKETRKANKGKGFKGFADSLSKWMYNHKMTNFMGRPVFMNNDCRMIDFMTKFVHLYTKLVVWTVQDQATYDKLKKKVNAIIFENIEM